MSVQTTGEVTVDVDRPTAFAIVCDPQRLARCIPGCHDVVELAENRYAATLSSQVAFMTLSFGVIIDVLRMEAPSAIDARITGDAVGLAGHVVANATVTLEEVGEARTRVRYAADVALSGKLGGLGQPVFRATSAKMAKAFGANLKAEIERGPMGSAA